MASITTEAAETQGAFLHRRGVLETLFLLSLIGGPVLLVLILG